MKTRLTVLVATMVLLAPQGASASCIRETARQQQARAQPILEGEIMSPTPSGKIRVRVLSYIKGTGPRELRLVGAGGEGVATSVDITPQPGERWRLLGRRDADGDFVSTACDGSIRLAADESAAQTGTPGAQAADGATRSVPDAVAASSDGDSGSAIWLAGIAVVVAGGLLASAFIHRRARRQSLTPARSDD